MMRLSKLACAGAFLTSRTALADGHSEKAAPTESEQIKEYVAPSVEGLHFAETFDGDVWSRWSHSAKEKYNGKFEVKTRKTEALVGDLGLLVPEAAKHYGTAAIFKPVEGKKDTPLVVQYEVKFEEGLTCGGAYMKLFNSEGIEATEFDNDTPYVIMFGPDKCGGTNKVHFILRHKNPKSGEVEEKHFKEAPSVPQDQLTHLYGFVVNPDNSLEIHIDGEKKASGNLLTSMEPPINPPAEIDDPADSKPGDWVDESRIDDPSSAKPDDWDEEAPARIEDTSATMPEGWNEDQEKKIPDPAAKKPDDWDDEEDGDWEAPSVENPACKVGCGPWKAPQISNPEYKGKWHAPKIDNPAYKGIWSARKIANPNYFVDESPCVLPTINGVGLDIWTMSGGLMFDNFVVATEQASAQAFADQSWKLRKEVEKLQTPKSSKGFADKAYDFVETNLIPVAVTTLVILLATIWFCCCRGDTAIPPPAPKQTKKDATNGAKKDEATNCEKKEEKEKAAEDKKDEEEDDKADAQKDEDASLHLETTIAGGTN